MLFCVFICRAGFLSTDAAQQQIVRLLQSDKGVEELERLVEKLWVSSMFARPHCCDYGQGTQ